MGTHPIFESDFDCLTDEIEQKTPRQNRKGTNDVRPFFTFQNGSFLVKVFENLSSRKRSCRIAAESVSPPTNRSPICCCRRVDAKVPCDWCTLVVFRCGWGCVLRRSRSSFANCAKSTSARRR